MTLAAGAPPGASHHGGVQGAPSAAPPASEPGKAAADDDSAASLMPIAALLSAITLTAYLAGLFQLSILWAVAVMSAVYFVINRRLKHIDMCRRFAVQRDAAIKGLDRHNETAEWLNFVIGRFWTVLEPVISAKIVEKVNVLFQGNCPAFLDSLELDGLTLGSSAPFIISAKVHPQTASDVIHMDLELCFVPNEVESDLAASGHHHHQHGGSTPFGEGEEDQRKWNSRVLLIARMGKGVLGVDIPILVKEVSIYGTMRVQIELAPTSPFISKVFISFLSQPKVGFVIKPVRSFDLMDVPGLSHWLNTLIKETLACRIVDPHMMPIPVDRFSGYADSCAIGVICVSLLRIRGVRMASTSSDTPHVRISIGGKIRAFSRRVDPVTLEWNEDIYVLVHSLKRPVVLVVATSAGVIGTVTHPIAPTMPATFPLSDLQQPSPGTAVSSTEPPTAGTAPLQGVAAGDTFKTTESFVAAHPEMWHSIAGMDSSAKTSVRGDLCCSVRFYPVMDTRDQSGSPTASPASSSSAPPSPMGTGSTVGLGMLGEQLRQSSRESQKSGIVHIILYQIKDLHDSDQIKKHPNCFYEIFIHPLQTTINPRAPAPATDEPTYYRSKTRKKTATPSWEDVFEVFVQDYSRCSITIFVRHAITEEIILATWSSSLERLIDRTDWFRFEDATKAQFYGAFLFRPICIPTSSQDGSAVKRHSMLGLLRLRAISLIPTRTIRADVSILADVNGRLVGRTRTKPLESAPSWSDTFVAIIRERSDKVTFNVIYGERKMSYGYISFAVSELTSMDQASEVERSAYILDTESGKDLPARIKFSTTLYVVSAKASPAISERPDLTASPTTLRRERGEPLEGPAHQGAAGAEERTGRAPSISEAKEAPTDSADGGEAEASSQQQAVASAEGTVSNCGILQINAILFRSLGEVRDAMLYAEIKWNKDEPSFRTNLVRPFDRVFEWKKAEEMIIYEAAGLYMTIFVRDASNSLVDTLTMPLAEVIPGHWYDTDDQTVKRQIQLSLQMHSLPLRLQAPVEEAGMLYVHVLDAKNLMLVDMNGKCDPYYILRLNDQKFGKSKVVKRNPNPVYDETCETVVRFKEDSNLSVELRDFNKITASRTLGHIDVPLYRLPPKEWVEINGLLQGATSGSIRIRVQFVPLTPAGRRGEAIPPLSASLILSAPSRESSFTVVHPPPPSTVSGDECGGDREGDLLGGPAAGGGGHKVEDASPIALSDDAPPSPATAQEYDDSGDDSDLLARGATSSMPAAALPLAPPQAASSLIDHDGDSTKDGTSSRSTLDSPLHGPAKEAESMTDAPRALLTITIISLVVEDETIRHPFDCKIKVRRDHASTVFKTRVIRNAIEHDWNETFTCEADGALPLSLLVVWSRLQEAPEIALDLAALVAQLGGGEDDERVVALPFSTGGAIPCSGHVKISCGRAAKRLATHHHVHRVSTSSSRANRLSSFLGLSNSISFKE